MMVESVADELLRRRDELNFDREHWVQRTPGDGQQCLVYRRVSTPPRLRLALSMKAINLLSWAWEAVVEDVNDTNSQDRVLELLDEAIAAAKDAGL